VWTGTSVSNAPMSHPVPRVEAAAELMGAAPVGGNRLGEVARPLAGASLQRV
jgi:hypothetical protein